MLARKIMDSQIWRDKPSWWLKVWMYILMRVNHTDNPQFKRGTNFFNTGTIYYDCALYNEKGVKERTTRNVISYLRKANMITCKKTTRGIIITVINYDQYQDYTAYRGQREGQLDGQLQGLQEDSERSTISNNGNNGTTNNLNNNEDKPLTPKKPRKKPDPELQDIILYAKEKGFALQGNRQQNRIAAFNLKRTEYKGKLLGVDGVKQLIDVAIACHGERYAPVVNDFVALKEKWMNLLSFVSKKQKGGYIG